MRTPLRSHSDQALTLVEAIACLAVTALLLLVVLPLLPHSHRSPRISCVNHLKQVGLAFQIYQNDHNGLFPMQVSELEGGALEAVSRGEIARIYQVMSNELNDTKVLICPADTRRRPVPATNWPAVTRENISYFVGLDAVDTKPNMILSGDRDIAENGELLTGLANLSTNRPVAWHSLLHQEGGNVGLADGSVQQLNTVMLLQALRTTGDTTNRVLFPQ